jgi:hypothetical protein
VEYPSLAGFRVAVKPEELQALVRTALELGFYAKHKPSTQKARLAAVIERKKEYKRVFDKAAEVPIARPKGGKTTLKKLVAELHEAIPEHRMRGLTPETVRSLSPFAELFQIPVGSTKRDGSDGHAARLGQIIRPVAAKSGTGFPLLRKGQKIGSHTIWMYAQWSWVWIPLIVAQFEASTWLTADGLDAALLLGGDYAAAARLCETPLAPGDIGTIIELIHDWACQYAESAPTVRYTAYQVSATACNCFACAANNSTCDFSDSNCDTSTEFNSAGPVSATHNDWSLSPTCLDVASQHVAILQEGDEPWVYTHLPN